jgi:hypothetical protein
LKEYTKNPINMLFHLSDGGKADGILVPRQRNYLNIKAPSISAPCHKVDTLKLYKIKFAKNNSFEMASVLSPFRPSAHQTFYSSTDPSFLSPPSPPPQPSSAAARSAAEPHFVETHETIEGVAETFWVEDDDTESMLPGAHVTANAIRHLLIKDYFYVNRKPSGFVLVDPCWLNGWEQLGMPTAQTPVFLHQDKNKPRLHGLVIPVNLDNSHWVVILVNVQQRHATLFDSIRSGHVAKRLERIMRRFYDAFYMHFDTFNGNDFNFHQDQNCGQQEDGSSCGLYTMSNILDLLNICNPCTDNLSEDEIINVRRKGQKILNEEEEHPPYNKTKEYFMSQQYLNTLEQPAN